MFDCSFKSQAPPQSEVKFKLRHQQLREAREALCQAMRLSKLPELQHLSVLSDLCLLVFRCAPNRYAYVRFHDNGELELFLPRDFNQNPRRVPC